MKVLCEDIGMILKPEDFVDWWKAHCSPSKQCVLLLDNCWASCWVTLCQNERNIQARTAELGPFRIVILACVLIDDGVQAHRCPMADKKIIETYVQLAIDKAANASNRFTRCSRFVEQLNSNH